MELVELGLVHNLLQSIPRGDGDVECAGVAAVGAEKKAPSHATAVVLVLSLS